MAVPEGNMSVMNVSSCVYIKAFLAIVSDVSSSSTVENGSLVNFLSPWSGSGSDTNSVACSLLVCNDEASVIGGSDGSGSSVEDPPLLVVLWIVISDSESVLTGSDVLSIEESSVVFHLRFDLESDVVSIWLLWICPADLINLPSLVLSVMAVPPGNMSSVSVSSTMDIKAFASDVSDSLSD